MRASLRTRQRFKAESQGAPTSNAEEDLPAKEGNRKGVANRLGKEAWYPGSQGKKAVPSAAERSRSMRAANCWLDGST